MKLTRIQNKFQHKRDLLKFPFLRLGIAIFIFVLTLNLFSVVLPQTILATQHPREKIDETNISKLTQIRTLAAHTHRIENLMFTPDGERLVSVGSDGKIILWDMNSSSFYQPLAYQGIGAAALSTDAMQVACDCASSLSSSTLIGDDSIEVRAVRSNSHIIQFDHYGLISALGFSPDTHLLAVASDRLTTSNISLEVWKLDTKSILAKWEYPNWISGVEFSPDQKSVAISTLSDIDIRNIQHPDQVMSLYQSSSPQSSPLYGLGLKVASLGFNTDGTELASMSTEGIVYLWNAANGTQIRFMESKNTAVDLTQSTYPNLERGLAFDSTDTLLAAGGGGVFRIWDVKTGSELITFPVQANIVQFNSDNTLLASANPNGTITLWGIPSSP